MITEIALINGEAFELLVDFQKLIAFKSTMKEQYQKFNTIVLNGPKDIFDMVYLAYCCYLMNSETKNLSYDGFINAIPEDMQNLASLNTIANQVIHGRKNKKVETLLQP